MVPLLQSTLPQKSFYRVDGVLHWFFDRITLQQSTENSFSVFSTKIIFNPILGFSPFTKTTRDNECFFIIGKSVSHKNTKLKQLPIIVYPHENEIIFFPFISQVQIGIIPTIPKLHTTFGSK